MERLQSVESSIDCVVDPASPQPQNFDSTNVIPTNIDEDRDLQRVYSSQSSNVAQPADDSSPISTPEISSETVPLVIPQITHSNSQTEETFQTSSAPVEEESSGSIATLIQFSEEYTVSKDSSAKTKSHTGKRSKKKRDAMKHTMEFATKQEIPNELNIPHTSTEFNHHGEQVPIHISQLCDVQKISHGEFGRVFSVVIKGTSDIPIAVKIIPRDKIKISEITIMQEVCAAEYPYIIDYHCALINSDNRSLCICMEYMDASIDALYKIIHRQENLDCDRIEQLVHRMVHDIASGLSYMERKEIIHRDIKPANLLINKNAVIKLCDFGISRSFARLNLYYNDIDDADYCSLSPLLHTENYMPPIIKGVIQDDMWSLGITLLEVIHGENPFARWNSGGRHFLLMRWEPEIPIIRSPEMHELIQDLLKKDPHLRPHSYDAILRMQSISDVLEPPSIDECEFIRDMIKLISQNGNFD